MSNEDNPVARCYLGRPSSDSGGVASDPPHKVYEKLVHSIFADQLNAAVAGSAPVEVVHDAKIRGKSGHEHQIDVLIRLKLAGFDLLIFVECKCYGRKVGIEEIMALKGRMDDCAAHKGIVVTTSGFQEGAVKIAKANGISIALMDGIRTEWSNLSDTRTNPRDILAALKHRLAEYLGPDRLRKAKTYLTDRRWRFRPIHLREVLKRGLMGAPTRLAFKKLGATVKLSDFDFGVEDGDFRETYSGQDKCCFVFNDSLEVKQQSFLRFVIWEALLEK